MKRLFLTGANGFLGSHIARKARAAGLDVRALVREGSDRSLLDDVEGIEWITGSIETTEVAHWGPDECDFVIHAAAATSEHTSDWETSRRINVEATRRLAKQAHEMWDKPSEQSAAKRFVFISSQSAHPANNSPYGATKLEAEKALAEIGVSHTTLRPGVIYGPERRGIFSKLEETLQGMPIIPLVGAGRYLQFPVYVEDVTQAALDVLECPAAEGQVYELGGAEPIAFRDLLKRLMQEYGTKKPLFPLPVPICRLIATVGERFLANPPITNSNIEGLLTAPPLDSEPARRDFGYDPLTLDAGLAKVAAARNAA